MRGFNKSNTSIFMFFFSYLFSNQGLVSFEQKKQKKKIVISVPPQVSTVTPCSTDAREGRVAMGGPALSPATPRMASSANVLR